MSGIMHLGVVIPACNEEHCITACLDSIDGAVRSVRTARPSVTCEVVVVLDRCTDRTGALAVGHGARTVLSDAGLVGCARHAGAMTVLHHSRRAAIPDHAVWLANTDADTTVRRDWLTEHLDIAQSGVDAAIGTVTPAGLDAAAHRRWHAEHQLQDGHPHVHGANLGLRADTYIEVGGFAPLSVNEDHDLVAKVRRVTNRWVATHRTTVTTSARTTSRVEGGFATYISSMGAGTSSCA